MNPKCRLTGEILENEMGRVVDPKPSMNFSSIYVVSLSSIRIQLCNIRGVLKIDLLHAEGVVVLCEMQIAVQN